MKLALIQSDLEWENAFGNMRNLAAMIHGISEPFDMIILPEMFSTGFTMNPKLVAEPMDGPTVSWMRATAAESQAAVCGSVVIVDSGNYYNRLLFVTPSGEMQQYDKRHLFSLAGEHKAYTAGNAKCIIEYKGWKICPLVCYDLRFPVFSRNVENYDLLIYVANWPEPRIKAWDILLKARAIENMSYVIGVNRIGTDGAGHNYIGHSQAVDYLGDSMIAPCDGKGVFIATLDLEPMHQTRMKLGFLNDRDDFTVN